MIDSIPVGSVVFDRKLKRYGLVYQLETEYVHLAFEGWLVKKVPVNKFNRCRYTIFKGKC